VASEEQTLLPVVDYLKIPETGEPFLEGLKCSSCSAVFIDERKHCAKCAARDALQKTPLSRKGRLHAFTIVERSYPGIPVPFVSAIVELDGGGVVKSNLIGVDVSDRESLTSGMAVELNFEKAPWGDEEGNEYMLFNFKLLDTKGGTV